MEISGKEMDNYMGPVNYKHHFEVINKNSSSTRLRIVYNSAQKNARSARQGEEGKRHQVPGIRTNDKDREKTLKENKGRSGSETRHPKACVTTRDPRGKCQGEMWSM